MNPRLDDLLSTLDVCEEILPFDLQSVHVLRLEAIRAILIEQGREKERKAPARVLSLVERSGRNDDHHRG